LAAKDIHQSFSSNAVLRGLDIDVPAGGTAAVIGSIAPALAMDPQVLFLDEATSALDPAMVTGILELIADLGAGGMTMAVVTHGMGFAAFGVGRRRIHGSRRSRGIRAP
jgi:ABC-type polar amino acid transport system ATPase subunit